MNFKSNDPSDNFLTLSLIPKFWFFNAVKTVHVPNFFGYIIKNIPFKLPISSNVLNNQYRIDSYIKLIKFLIIKKCF